MLRQTSLPLPLFLLRCLIRNIINLGHHIVIVVLVLLYVGHFPGVGILWSAAGLGIACVNLGWLMVMTSFLSARYRDVPQIIAAALQITFFLTPVFWQVTPAMANSPLVVWNPFFYMVDVIRRPLLTTVPPLSEYALLVAMAVAGWVAAILIYNQTRRRVVHFL